MSLSKQGVCKCCDLPVAHEHVHCLDAAEVDSVSLSMQGVCGCCELTVMACKGSAPVTAASAGERLAGGAGGAGGAVLQRLARKRRALCCQQALARAWRRVLQRRARCFWLFVLSVT